MRGHFAQEQPQRDRDRGGVRVRGDRARATGDASAASANELTQTLFYRLFRILLLCAAFFFCFSLSFFVFDRHAALFLLSNPS